MKFLLKICLWSLAFIPLIVDSHTFFPTIMGKTLFIQSVLVIFSILFIFYSIWHKVDYSKLKRPLVLICLIFVSISIISTFLADDPFLALWGNLERGEGLLGLVSYFAFFVFSLLVFDRQDWLWFFRLSLIATTLLLWQNFSEFFNGITRPYTSIGNPAFVAGYFLFSITSAWLVFRQSKWFWKIISFVIGLASVAGLFITQTRGTILGLFVGFFVVLSVNLIKNRSKLTVVILTLFVSILCLFVFTRSSEIWLKVPGISRLAVTKTDVRIIIWNMSLKAVSPETNGWKKTLIGWGPENYIYASTKYFDERLKQYSWAYDRPHNKILEILVTTGIFGLVSYLVLWLYILWLVRKRGILLFFFTAFFVHLFFLFDMGVTSIPFWGLLAYLIYDDERRIKLPTKIIPFILILFLIFSFSINTLPGYLQTRKYTAILELTDLAEINRKIDFVFIPFSSAQSDIRRDFLRVAIANYKKYPNEFSLSLKNKSVIMTNDYLEKRPKDLRFKMVVHYLNREN